jgi:hypothetical protein
MEPGIISDKIIGTYIENHFLIHMHKTINESNNPWLKSKTYQIRNQTIKELSRDA